MNSVLIEFKNGSEEIRKFIDNSKMQNHLFVNYKRSENKDLVLKPREVESEFKNFVLHYESFNNKKIFEYNTIIISLYGYFENFIEELIKAYIRTLSSFISVFQEMPQKIVENHTQLSAQLIQNINMPKYQGVVSQEKIVSNMASCQEGESYTVNVDAYTHHTANFRESVINEFFLKVGIENISSLILKYPLFKSYLDENEIDKSIAFNIINDLADRRNQVAHGSVDSILDKDILSQYLDFLDLYCDSLYSVLFMNILDYRVSKNTHQYRLNSPIAVYGRDVVCFEIANTHIQLGDTLYAKTNNEAEPIRYGTVLSMRLNDVDVSEVKEDQVGSISIKVDCKVNMRYEYFIPRLQPAVIN
ncbi:MAE_28990/MAE_18760 family HEPN-like nuclease [Sutcliffiella halmapala]